MQSADNARTTRGILYLAKNFRNPPDLSAAARAAGMSEAAFRRLLTRWAGIGPKRFLQFLSAENTKKILEESSLLLEASRKAGLSGPGRLHDLIVDVHAVTKRELRELEGRGADFTIRYGVHRGPFGPFFLAMMDKGVCALSFLSGRAAGKEIAELRKTWNGARIVKDQKVTKAVAERIFLRPGKAPGVSLSVIVKGTDFQVKVWEALLRIPPGFFVSYEDVAVVGRGSPRGPRGRERRGAKPRCIYRPLPPGDPEDGGVREVRGRRGPENPDARPGGGAPGKSSGRRNGLIPSCVTIPSRRFIG